MSLSARDIMNPDVVTARHNLLLPQLVLLLQTNAVTGLPVLDDEGSLVGVVSASDLLSVQEASSEDRQALGASHYHARTSGSMDSLDDWQDDGRHKRVAGIMSTNVISASGDTTVSDLAEQMVSHDIHRVVICDGSDLIGIVSSLDILRAVSKGRIS